MCSEWLRASPSKTEFPHWVVWWEGGMLFWWSDVIYCLLCFRIILKFALTICMLSSSQDQLSLVRGAAIKEGKRIRLILTCGLWELWLVFSAASYTWATASQCCPRSCFLQAVLWVIVRGGWTSSPARIKWLIEEGERAAAQSLENRHV